jgi:hypothetical protein
VPWRERKAMGTEACVRTVMGEEGAPQGVVSVRVAMGVKPERCWRPVPPITAIWMGPGVGMSAYFVHWIGVYLF